MTADIVYDIIDIVYDITAASIVRRVREEARLSQRDLAARAQTSQAVVARIESGASEPAFETVKRLTEAAGLRLDVSVAPQRVVDPVVEAYKPGVDKTLLIEQLRRSPQQLIEDLIGAHAGVEAFRRAGYEARRRVAEGKASNSAKKSRP